MATRVTFTKSKATLIDSQLLQGKPLTPPGGIWTPENLFHVCGAASGYAFSRLLKLGCDGQHRERREAVTTGLHADLPTILRHYMLTSMLIGTGKYDEHYDAKLVAIVDGKTITPESGARGQRIVQFNQ